MITLHLCVCELFHKDFCQTNVIYKAETVCVDKSPLRARREFNFYVAELMENNRLCL